MNKSYCTIHYVVVDTLQVKSGKLKYFLTPNRPEHTMPDQRKKKQKSEHVILRLEKIVKEVENEKKIMLRSEKK